MIPLKFRRDENVSDESTASDLTPYHGQAHYVEYALVISLGYNVAQWARAFCTARDWTVDEHANVGKTEIRLSRLLFIYVNTIIRIVKHMLRTKYVTFYRCTSEFLGRVNGSLAVALPDARDVLINAPFVLFGPPSPRPRVHCSVLRLLHHIVIYITHAC